MNDLNEIISKEEIRIIHQSLNEICNGLHFEDSEFETRVGATKSECRKLMLKLESIYNEDEIK